MSHFTCLVAANDEQELHDRLLPYHEYECTGITEYIEFQPADMKELEEEWEKRKDDLSDSGHKLYFTLDEFAADYYGYKKNDEGVYGRWTNPNSQWDWWTIGGRWTGLLQLKPEAVGNGYSGQPGLLTPPNTDPQYADSALASEIDWEASQTDNPPLTFAFIDTEGAWHQRAEMGWFAVTTDSNDAYAKEFEEFIANLDPDQRLFVIDCHI